MHIRKKIQQPEDITIINMILKYVKQKLAELKGKIEKFTKIAEDFNNLLSIMVRTTREKIRK